MTSSNHFRGRTLAANKAATWPPRQRRRQAATVTPPLPPMSIAWSIAAVGFFAASNVTARTDEPVSLGGDNYQVAGTDDEGHAFLIDIFYDVGGAPITFSYKSFQGGAFRELAEAEDDVYPGGVPYTSLALDWVPSAVSATGDVTITVN